MNYKKIAESETKYIIYVRDVFEAKIHVTPYGRKIAYISDGDSWRNCGISVSTVFGDKMSAYIELERRQINKIKKCIRALRKTRTKMNKEKS